MIVLHHGRGRLRLPAHTRAAIDVVVACDELDVADLVPLDEESRRVLARRLIREGIVYIAE